MPIIDRTVKIDPKQRLKMLQEQKITSEAREKELIKIVSAKTPIEAGVGTIGTFETVEKAARPFALETEQKIAQKFSGSSVGVRKVSIPMRNIRFGLSDDDRWWDSETAVDKGKPYEFTTEIQDLDGNKIRVSRVWSESRQRKVFYGETSDGAARNMDHLDSSRMIPYFLDEALKTSAKQPIVICEGYRAAKAVQDQGFAAVGAIDGSTIPHPDIFAKLKGRSIILWPDNDDVGVALMASFRVQLMWAGAREVKLVRWSGGPLHGDAANIAGPKETIDKLLEGAMEWPAPLLENVAEPPRIERLGNSIRLRSESIIARGGRR